MADLHLSGGSRSFSPAEASPCFCNSYNNCARRTRMKRVALLLFVAGWLVPLARAQDHFQVGAYGDYFRITQTNTDLAGLGGRAAVKILPHVMLEGEMSYDFEQAFTERCLSSGCTDSVALISSSVTAGFGLSSW